jgi:uncharacterized protein YdbL (DUF1318 family)
MRILKAVLLLIFLALATPALASPLDDAKAAGQVGERVDGYAGAVQANASAAIRSMVDDINAKRRASYAEIAKKQGVATAVVAAIAGKKLVERAPRGEYVMGAGGTWTKKP